MSAGPAQLSDAWSRPWCANPGLAETIYRFNFVAVVHGHAYGGRYNGKTPRGTPVHSAVAHVEQPRQPLVLVRGGDFRTFKRI